MLEKTLPLLKKTLRFVVAVAALLFTAFVGLFSLYGFIQGRDVPSGLYHLFEPARDPVVTNPAAKDIAWHRVSWVTDIENASLDESSGLTMSHLLPDVFWSINDSGSEPVIYAFNLAGETLGEWTINTQANIDWESMDSFEQDGIPYLVIGDTGDNFRWRPSVSILVVREPSLEQDNNVPLKVAWQIDFQYPEGFRDSEALAVDTNANRIYVLSKRHYPPELFQLPLTPPKDNQSSLIAEHVADLVGFPQPTEAEYETENARYRHMPGGMDLADDALFITTYKHAYLFDITNISAQPLRVKLPSLGQRESLSFAHGDDQVAYITKERRNGKGVADLFKIELEPPSNAQIPGAVVAGEQ